MNCLDENGEMRPATVVESVQFRQFMPPKFDGKRTGAGARQGRWGEHLMAVAPFHGYSYTMNHNTVSQKQDQRLPAPSGLSVSGEFDQNKIDFTPSGDEVARRAYFAYVNQGSPPGRDVQHWLAAEAELIAERNLTRTHGFHNHPPTKFTGAPSPGNQPVPAPVTQHAEPAQTPVFPKTLHQMRSSLPEATTNPKPQKRDNIFSKSRDTREDRGTRQAKTTNNSQTLSRGS